LKLYFSSSTKIQINKSHKEETVLRHKMICGIKFWKKNQPINLCSKDIWPI